MKFPTFTQIKSLFTSAPGAFVGRGELGGWYSLNSGDGWQRNLRIDRNAPIAAVQAAVSKHVDALTAMPLGHFGSNGTSKVEDSVFTRWARRPTHWQTLSEWLSEGERALMETGNAVGLISYDDRYQIKSITWAQHWSVHVDPTTGELFYSLQMPQQFGTHDYTMLTPAREVLHMRINTDRSDPMRGRSPLVWCAAALATNATLSNFLVSFLQNRASPSYILSTDAQLSAVQIRQLREAWDAQSQGLSTGKTPILSAGLKPLPMGVAPTDQTLVSTFNLSIEDICRAFNLPRALLGVGGDTAGNSQALIREWVSLSLGSHIEMWEQSLERAFDLPDDESIEFSTDALLRMSPIEQAQRIKELVIGGILSADEARAQLSMAPIKGGYGKLPSTQQQMIPLDLLHNLHAANISSKQPDAAPSPKALVADAIRRAKQESEF